jgi:hypothetical protein
MRGMDDGFRDMPGSIAESEVGMRFDDSVALHSDLSLLAFHFWFLTSGFSLLTSGMQKYEVRMKK